ncbi:MAG TPA: tRNA lysidine(34) synthetase TilS [Armatimonadota bacterium]|jgi:tRNA(Ile)-lysidine synthase
MKRRCGASPAEEETGLRARLEAADRKWALLAGVRSVLVAVSGGPDSVALLHLLWTLREERGLRLGVAHLNHGLRGAEADADAAHVAALAAQLDLPLIAETAGVPALAAERGLSLEAAARQARYEFLERAAATGDWDRVALGHTASDRVESVLLNLLRGSGLHGLRGMPARRERFIRPLLLAERAETEAYCHHFELHPRLDATNLDPESARRNRVRLELLPLLREQYNPAVEAALLRLAEAAEAELDWTEPQVQALADEIIRPEGEGLALDLGPWATLPAGARYRVLREAWTRLTGEVWELGAAGYEDLEDLALRAQTGREIHLPGDFRAQKGYNKVVIAPVSSPDAPPGPQFLLDAGEWRLPEWGATVRVERLDRRPGELGSARGCQIVIDATAAAAPWGVRGWQPGDALVPLGMSGHRKLQDLFTDLKVPASARTRVPLVVDAAGEIVWVVGCALSDRVRVTGATREFLRITWKDLAALGAARGEHEKV